MGLPGGQRRSTAFNLDSALAARRSCFEGYETWLNQSSAAATYAAGDLWGCVGMWFSGRWYTAAVARPTSPTCRTTSTQRIWERPEFIAAT